MKDKYAYKTIEEYEMFFGSKTNFAFRTGWQMARVTEKQLGIKPERFIDMPLFCWVILTSIMGCGIISAICYWKGWWL